MSTLFENEALFSYWLKRHCSTLRAYMYLHGKTLSLVGGLPSSSSHLLPSVYIKIFVPADRAKTWPSWVCACSICPDLSLVGEAQTAKVFMETIWLAPQGHPTFKASDPLLRVTLPLEHNFAIFHVNGSLLVMKKCMKSSLTRGSSVWRVTLLPGTTVIHVNRPLEVFVRMSGLI